MSERSGGAERGARTFPVKPHFVNTKVRERSPFPTNEGTQHETCWVPENPIRPIQLNKPESGSAGTKGKSVANSLSDTPASLRSS